MLLSEYGNGIEIGCKIQTKPDIKTVACCLTFCLYSRMNRVTLTSFLISLSNNGSKLMNRYLVEFVIHPLFRVLYSLLVGESSVGCVTVSDKKAGGPQVHIVGIMISSVS